MYKINKIISGGQTGADRAGLDAARAFGIKTDGYCPKNFMTEAGSDLSLKTFGLKQTASSNPSIRTKLNAVHSDGTVIFCKSDTGKTNAGDGTIYTLKVLKDSGKPHIINPNAIDLTEWIVINKIKTLNVAGNRESKYPGVYKNSLNILKGVFKGLSSNDPDLSILYFSFKNKIQTICKDNSSGSLKVLNNLMQSISEYLKSADFKEVVIKKHLISVLMCLRKGKNRDMHSIQSFLTSFFRYCNNVDYSKYDIIKYLKEYIKHWKSINIKIIEKFIRDVNINNKTILLHSNSNMIECLFKEIKRINGKVNVIQCMSSPENEGTIQYRILTANGINCRLINDDAIEQYTKKLDFAVLGCDVYSNKYFLNKKGSYKIAKELSKINKPVYVLTDKRKYKKHFDRNKIQSKMFEAVPRKYVILYD